MQIWSAEKKELETLYTSVKGQFPELEKELEQLIRTEDANVVMLYSRRCLEVIVTDLCEKELKRPRKTEPLKGIIDKLNREEKVPSNIITSMQHLNSLSTYGAHPKDFDLEQVKPVLNNLTTILKWYLKYKEPQAISKQKTEEVKDEAKGHDDSSEHIQKPKKKLILLLSGLTLVGAIVIVALFVFNIIGGGKRTKELEKSIAVLPFVNDSPDEENTYFINGIMDEVLINLQTIKDLRVISRNSVEQYRGPDKPSTPEIAKKMNVNYIVEGSGQKYGNTIRLRVQLLDGAKDRHLWGKSYEQEILEPNDIFNIQSQIAQAIADELTAIITPEEKQLIDKTSTTSLTAYDFYQRGRNEYIKYWIDNKNRAALEKAEYYYHQALEYDPTFAQTYAGLARVYYDKHFWETYYTEKFLDSVPVLCGIALSYDNQVADAYIVRGNYYRAKGMSDKAIDEYNKALKLNPNSWEAYYGTGLLYYNNNDDLLMYIDLTQKAASLNRGSELPSLLRDIGLAYHQAGFPEKADYYFIEALKLDGDSVHYLSYLSYYEFNRGNFNKSVEFGEKVFKKDSTNTDNLFYLGSYYSFLGKYKESLIYFKKYIKILETFPEEYTSPGSELRIGFTYWQNGYRKEAEYYFNKQIEYCYSMIKLSRYRSPLSYYDLAAIYAFRGEREKAYENLKIFNQKQIMPKWAVTYIKTDPFFDNIRDEPEFQQIAREIETKYQAEHERVRKWLEGQGAL